MTDKKTDITFGEFQSWMLGLIEGKGGALPDINDWKRIKIMLDRVKPDVEIIPMSTNIPQTPYSPIIGFPSDIKINPSPNIWCNADTNITVSMTEEERTTDIINSLNKLKEIT